MKYLTALWHAVQAFFAHLRIHERTEQATQQQAAADQQTTAARDRADAEMRNADQRDRDRELGKWLRD